MLEDAKAYFAGWQVEEGKYDADSGMPQFPVRDSIMADTCTLDF